MPLQEMVSLSSGAGLLELVWAQVPVDSEEAASPGPCALSHGMGFGPLWTAPSPHLPVAINWFQTELLQQEGKLC